MRKLGNEVYIFSVRLVLSSNIVYWARIAHYFFISDPVKQEQGQDI